MPLGMKKESPVKALYRQLDTALAEVVEIRRRHKNIFAQLAEADDKVKELQGKIKLELVKLFKGKDSGMTRDYEGKHVVVEVTAKNERIFDGDSCLKKHRAVLEEIGAIKHVPPQPAHDEVDLSVLDSAIYAKTIDKAIRDEFIKAGEAITPSVSFKLPKPDNKEK